MDWYPWYPALFEADTAHLTTLEVGAYKLLIDRYMLTRQPLMDHDQALANYTRLPLEQWLSIRSNIRCFFKPKSGRLHHKRCDLELEDQDKRQRNVSKAGKASAEKRASIRNALSTPVQTPDGATVETDAPTPVRTDAEVQDKTEDKTGQESKKDDDAARAKVGMLARRDEADVAERETFGKVYAALESILNWANPFDGSRIHAWLKAGADPELDVYPTVKRLMAAAGDKRISSLRYFDNAIAEAVKARTSGLDLPAFLDARNRTNGHGRPTLRRAPIAELRPLLEAEATKLGVPELTPRARREFLTARGIDPNA